MDCLDIHKDLHSSLSFCRTRAIDSIDSWCTMVTCQQLTKVWNAKMSSTPYFWVWNSLIFILFLCFSVLSWTKGRKIWTRMIPLKGLISTIDAVAPFYETAMIFSGGKDILDQWHLLKLPNSSIVWMFTAPSLVTDLLCHTIQHFKRLLILSELA